MYNVNVKEVIEKLIGYFSKGRVEIREDGIVDINLSDSEISSLEEVRYLLLVEEVGDFNCSECNNLRDLRGSPSVVKGSFICNLCKNLSDLEGCSRYVGNNFYSRFCIKLESLKGGPSIVVGEIDCSLCGKLKEIKFDVEIIGKSLICIECQNLEYIDSDIVRKVGGKVYIKGCDKIRNIKELIKEFGNKINKRSVYV